MPPTTEAPGYLVDSLDDPEPELPELEEPVALGVELEEPDELGVELEEPVAPELDEPLALCSRWHCSSAAPLKPVQSGFTPAVPVEAGSDALPVEEEVPLVDGVALLDDDPLLGVLPLEPLPLDMLPLALELSVPDDPLVLCAHDTVAKPSRDAVIAALSTFIFMAGIPLGLGLPRR